MKKSVIFLEPKGTILEVVRAAKERGFHVVAISSDQTLLDHAPAAYRSAVPMIDETVAVKNWQDEDVVTSISSEIHRRNPIAGIYAGMDPCAAILAKLRLTYGFPTPRPEAIKTVLDKFALRKKLRELSLSRIRNFPGKEVDQWTSWPLQGAAYFKPTHGFFSAYVKKCEGMDDLRAAQSLWREGTPGDPQYVKNYLRSSNEYHLEESFDGELLSVEGLVTGGRFHALGILSRILYSKDPVVEMGSCFPYPHPQSEKIVSLVKNAHEALGLTDGPTHTEVIVNGEGEVEIIDLNPRFVGADVLQSINHAYGIRVENALLDYALGNEPRIEPTERNYSCLQYFLPPSVPTLESVAFPVRPEVRFHAKFIEPGSKISNANRQLDYLGCYLTVMQSFDQAIVRSRELRSEVRVNQAFEGVF